MLLHKRKEKKRIIRKEDGAGPRAGRCEWEKQKLKGGMQSVFKEKEKRREKTLGWKWGEVQRG